MPEPVDPLKDLRDIHYPDPVSFWPPALGWWIVGLLCLGLIALMIWGVRRFRTPSVHRAAWQELEGLRQAFASNHQEDKLVRGLSVLLRRYAMACYGREQVAGLAGYRWLSFLDEKGETTAFTEGPGRVLASVPYGGQDIIQGPELLAVVERWLNHTRRRAS